MICRTQERTYDFADEEGFEPPVFLSILRFSRPTLSTAQTFSPRSSYLSVRCTAARLVLDDSQAMYRLRLPQKNAKRQTYVPIFLKEVRPEEPKWH
ncbi:hypothetical protein V6N11_043176 [Hibiscus sabdariffa]|uniref:Uncharacterized protein n=1 Tax=Hibiscus sabdariffa TaxID=183260 RepID=A0ABR2QYK9_9ROSI